MLATTLLPPPSATSAKPVVWIASVSRQFTFLRDAVARFGELAEAADVVALRIGLDNEGIAAIRQRIAHERCDAIIASGTHATALRKEVGVPLGVPVVTAAASGFDIMHALARARRITDQIGMLTHGAAIAEVAEFSHTFGCNIAQDVYHDVGQAREQVAAMRRAGVKAVVGSGFIADLAFEAGMVGIFVFSDASLKRICNETLTAIRRQSPALGPRRTSDGMLVHAISLYSQAPATTVLHDDGPLDAPREQVDTEAYVALHCESLVASLREKADLFSF